MAGPVLSRPVVDPRVAGLDDVPELLEQLPEPSRTPQGAAAEVETEFEEEEGEEEEEEPQEVEEEEDTYEEHEETLAGNSREGASSHDGTSSASSTKGPEEVWKQFGCETEAGRMLRKLYGNANQTKAASKVSYPKLRSNGYSWQPGKPERRPCPQQTAVKVPQQVRRRPDPDDPQNWRVPLPGRKPAADIMAEMEASKPEKPNLPQGRDQAAEKHGLQDRFQYCGGNAMPKGAMGYVPKAEMPQGRAPAPEDHHSYVDTETGMTREQREIFEELTLAIKYKKERLKEIDAHPGQKLSKAKTDRNKEALQLQNDIDSLFKDIDKLMELTDH